MLSTTQIAVSRLSSERVASAISAFKSVNGIEVDVRNPFAITIPVLRLDYRVHKGDDILADGQQSEAGRDSQLLEQLWRWLEGLFALVA